MNGTFAAALERREQVIVVDPRDGTVIDLQAQPHEALIDVLLELRRREAQMKAWKTAVEDELIRRHGDRRGAETVGAWEIDVERGRGRIWDSEELELVCVDLIGRDLLSLQDIAGLIVRETKVDGRKAQALLGRVSGEAETELRRCFRWEQKGRSRVKLTPVASLEPGRGQG